MNIPWSRKWQHTPVFLPGKFHGWRSPAFSLWGCKESDTSEHEWMYIINFNFFFRLSITWWLKRQILELSCFDVLFTICAFYLNISYNIAVFKFSYHKILIITVPASLGFRRFNCTWNCSWYIEELKNVAFPFHSPPCLSSSSSTSFLLLHLGSTFSPF